MVVNKVGRRPVWSAEDARELLARWKKSGEPLGAWCAREGVVRQSLQWWKGREGVETSTPLVRIAEVALLRPAFEARYRVELGCGRAVVVDGAFDAEALSRLIDVVDR